jgi:hypothetical protein
MNIGSVIQIRQLLFPDPEQPTRAFKADNEQYEQQKVEFEAAKQQYQEQEGVLKSELREVKRWLAKASRARTKAVKAGDDGDAAADAVAQEQGSPDEATLLVKQEGLVNALTALVKPVAPRRYTEVVLHGIWGPDVPGRLQVESKTAKGAAAVSGAVLRSLAGKPGAAAKALAALDAAEAEEAARAAAAAGAAAADVLDDPHEAWLGEEEAEEEGEAAEASTLQVGSRERGSAVQCVVGWGVEGKAGQGRGEERRGSLAGVSM